MITCIKKKLLQRRFDTKKLRETDLVYSATARCACGAGLAYISHCHLVKGAEMAWDCSDILMQRALSKEQKGKLRHSSLFPFEYWKINSEKSSSSNGLTTRGHKTPPCDECQKGKTDHYSHFEYMGKLAASHWDKEAKTEAKVTTHV